MKFDIIQALEYHAVHAEKEARFGSRDLFRNTATSLCKFTKKKSLPFDEVNPEFLRLYSKWMQIRGKRNGQPASISTVGIYTRNIRTIFNHAIHTKAIPADSYPFGRGGFSAPSSMSNKRALSTEQLQQVLAYESDVRSKQEKILLWKLGYYCSGANMADILTLRWSDFDTTSFTFVRRKTEHSVKQVAPITVHLIPEARKIFEALQFRSRSPLILPFLRLCKTEEEMDKKINGIICQTNRVMKEVAKELGINSTLSTVTARHSFATTLSRKEVPLAFISKSLGHSSLETTGKYLASFELEKTMEYMSELVL